MEDRECLDDAKYDGYSIHIFAGSLGIDEDNDNVDVEVCLNNGDCYIATFFTVKNINYMFEKNSNTGEFSNGLYFWASNMVIVEKLSERNVKSAVEDLITRKELDKLFLLVSPKDEIV